MRNFAELLLGSVLTYGVVAACSAAGGNLVGNDSGTGGTGGSLDAAHEGAMPTDSSLVDAIVSPVPDAKAEPVSGSRLKARYRVGDDGSREPLTSWYDSLRQESCTFATAWDGTKRCLPEARVLISQAFFADASCTQDLALYALGSCQEPRYAFRTGTVNSSCPGSTGMQFFTLGSVHTGTIYMKPDGNCTASSPDPGIKYYRVGTIVEPGGFVGSTEEVDD